MKVVLTTLNAKFIHTNLALRWLYVARPKGMDVVINEFTIRDNLDHCTEKLCQENPDILGISVYIWNSNETKKWIKKIKEKLPHTRIILGGPEVSFDADDWLNYPIECILRGEGEEVFWRVCLGDTEVDGYLSKKKQSKIAFAEVDLSWLETLESPYFLEMDQETKKNRYQYLETSRGCPYQCSYCLSSNSKVRLFSMNYIYEMLDKMEKVSCKQVKFLDRTFNVHPKRALDIAMKIQSMDVNYSFQVEVVADTLSEELLNFFKSHPEKFRFEIGVQSFNPKTLQTVSRFQNMEKLTRVIKEMNQAKNHLHVDLIAGLPYEGRESFKNSFHQLFQCFSDEIQVGLLKLLPGTTLRKQAKELKMIYEKDAPYTIISTPWMSKEEIHEIIALYHATEKLYNSSRLRCTFNYLFQNGIDLFELLVACGKEIEQFAGQIQVYDMFQIVKKQLLLQTCRWSEDEIDALLSTDYYRLFKQTPKRLFNNFIHQKKKKEVFASLVQQGFFSEQRLHRYGKLEWGYKNNKKCMQLILYDALQNVPKVYWIEEKGGTNYGIMDCNSE